MADQSKKPADTPFKQQRLPAWQPILSPPWVISCFFLVALVFLPIGVVIIITTGQVVEVEERYDITPEKLEEGEDKVYGRMSERYVRLKVPAEMKPPVFMYYKLDNFYQNHRRYTKSRSDKQSAGNQIKGVGDIGDCGPYRYAGEVFKEKENENNLESFYAPCGLIAYSMFNDTFQVYLQQKTDVPCNETIVVGTDDCPAICETKLKDEDEEAITTNQCTSKNIAWASDRKKKFAEPNPGKTLYSAISDDPSKRYYYREGPDPEKGIEGHLIPNQEDEDFMVWMRTASLPTFRKLYRIFPDQGFEEDQIIWIRVQDRFDVSEFGGHKYIILSTATWIGGKNYFLGVAYVVIGCICFILALVFVIKHVTGGRNGMQ